MPHRYEKLLTPLVLGNGAVLKNRMIQPKCCPDQIQGPEEWPNEQFIHFHREAARKGNSLVVLCDAFRPDVRKMPASHDFSHSYSFNLDDPAVHNYFCQLSDDVHYYGSKVVVSLAPVFPQGVTLGGSSFKKMQTADGFVPMPPVKMATKEQIKESIDAVVERLSMYQSWGYDGCAITPAGLEHETDLRTDEEGYGYMAPYWEHFDNLKGITTATTTRVTAASAAYLDADGAEHTLEGDEVIICGGAKPNVDAALKYAAAAPEFYMIGDAGGGKDIQTGVRSAFGAASQI